MFTNFFIRILNITRINMTAIGNLIPNHRLKVSPSIRRILEKKRIFGDEWLNVFLNVHLVWDANSPTDFCDKLMRRILNKMKQIEVRVTGNVRTESTLNSYISEWRKFYTHCNTTPMQITMSVSGKISSVPIEKSEEISLRKFMLNIWTENIFFNIKDRLQSCAMKIVNAERMGEAYDSRLVIALRESYIGLCSNQEDKLFLYKDYFEKPYIEAMKTFYRLQASLYLQSNSAENYVHYVIKKIREEEIRAKKYLQPHSNPMQDLIPCCVTVLISAIFVECGRIVKENNIEKLIDIVQIFGCNSDDITSLLDKDVVNNGLADLIAASGICRLASETIV